MNESLLVQESHGLQQLAEEAPAVLGILFEQALVDDVAQRLVRTILEVA